MTVPQWRILKSDGKSESQDDVGEEEWEEIEETVNQSEISLLETLEQINERKV